MQIEIMQVVEVLAPMQGGQRAIGKVVEQREMVAIEMEVQNIELIGDLAHARQHGEMRGQIPGDVLVEAQGHIAAGHEVGPGLAVPAGEKGDIVAARDERVAEMGYNTLRPAVEFWRDGFVKGGDLGDTHRRAFNELTCKG